MADTSEPEGYANEEHAASSSPRPSPRRTAANTNMNNTQDAVERLGDDGTSPRKMGSPRSRATAAVAGGDNYSTDTKSSGVSGDSGAPLSNVSVSPKHKDPDRIKKDREREERVRQARERLEEERKKKLVELQEQQRQAQENREKQLEMRRKKIEDLRRRDVERRAEVEKRRREKEDAERSRRESLLLKAEERVARYEAWKRGGQKGPPPGGAMPTTKHLSVSTSVLYHKRNTEYSSSGTLNVSNRPDSLIALNTIPEGRRSFLAPSAPPPSRPKSVMTLSTSSTSSATGGVKLRESKSPRKPRPASVGTSMPSFVNVEVAVNSPRSKSTDRLARERSRPRGGSAVRRSEIHEDKDKEKDRIKDQDRRSCGGRISRSTLDRLSTPRQQTKPTADGKETASTPRRESPIARMSPRKAYSTSNLAMPRKKPTVRERTPKEVPSKTHKPESTTVTPTGTPSSGVAAGASASPTPGGATPSTPASRTPSRTPVRVLSPTPGADEDGGSNVPTPSSRPTATPTATSTPSTSSPSVMEKSTGDITAEEYKAKLAEKRRQAREKAEKEAEEERKRQEELERQEEERRLQEEEEQRRQDEEAMRMATEARKQEEERLQKAIEAEEARKAEEAQRMEQERLAKEEAEKKAREEAERLELERQEKARKEEEERLERKKRLEMIMKRVKTDNTGEGQKEANKSVTSSPTKSVASTASSDASPMDPENKTVLAMSEQSAASSARPEDGESPDAPPPVPAEATEGNLSPGEGSLSPPNAPSPVTVPAQEPAAGISPPGPESEQEKAAETDDVQLEIKRAEPSLDPPAEESQPSASSTPRSGTPENRAATPENGGEKSKFKSPLLQKLVEGKEDSAGSPRFKSPLLQNLLGKTKVGARMGLTQDHSASTPNLTQVDRPGNQQGEALGVEGGAGMSASMINMETAGGSASKEVMNRADDKDVDTSEESSTSPSSAHSSPSHAPGDNVMVANGNQESGSLAASTSSQRDGQFDARPEPMDISSSSTVAPGVMATSAASLWSEQDSGASFGTGAPSASLQVSLNGHSRAVTAQGQGLEDSSISMRSVESVTSSITDSAAGSVFSSVSSLPQGQGQSTSTGDRDFEELIDLSVNNKTSSGVTTTTTPSALTTVLDNAADLVNFNKLDVEAETELEGSAAGPPPPIIAFEESSTIRRQDVPDLLS